MVDEMEFDLPEVKDPTFSTTLSTGKIYFRPYKVYEEKKFLIAEESKDPKEIIRGMSEVLQTCMLSDIKVSSLYIFDIEKYFLALRANSVNNISELTFRDRDDGTVYKFAVDLNTVELEETPGHSRTVSLEHCGFTLTFGYPTLKTIDRITSWDEKDHNNTIEQLGICLETINANGVEVDATQRSVEKRVEFIGKLSSRDYDTIVEKFIKTMPRVRKVLNYTNKNSKDRMVVLEGWRDFFPYAA